MMVEGRREMKSSQKQFHFVPWEVIKSITSEVKFMQNRGRSLMKKDSLGDVLRFWRKNKRKSQMDLALESGISPKHLSFIETGRSKPSRGVILKLGRTLKLTLRHQNSLLLAGGYSSEFKEEPFGGEKMDQIRRALKSMLAKHEPYPALVVNGSYDILMTNSGLEKLAAFFLGEDTAEKYSNVYRLLFAEDGLCNYIIDWQVIGSLLLARLFEEATLSQNPPLLALYREIAVMNDGNLPDIATMDHGMPVMTFSLEKASVRVTFFTTITTLGTPLDLTTQEIKIESLFPVDEKSHEFFTTR